jgi:hypothetical protein
MHYVEDYNIFLRSQKNEGMFIDWVFLEHQMFDDQAILVNLTQKIACNFIF